MSANDDLSFVDKNPVDFTDQDLTLLEQTLEGLDTPDYEADIPDGTPLDLSSGSDEVALSEVTLILGGSTPNYVITLTKPAGAGAGRGDAPRLGRFSGQFRRYQPIPRIEPVVVLVRAPAGRITVAWVERSSPCFPIATFVETGATGNERTRLVGLFSFR